ncbi:MAG: hypothetical protein ACLUNO_14150 [Oscillospiraceae bacterium]
MQNLQKTRKNYGNLHQKAERKDFINVKSVLSIDFRTRARYNASAIGRWEDLGWHLPVTKPHSSRIHMPGIHRNPDEHTSSDPFDAYEYDQQI